MTRRIVISRKIKLNEVNFAIWGSHLSKHITIKNKMFDDESINLDRGMLIIYEKGGEYFAYFQVYNDQSIITMLVISC